MENNDKRTDHFSNFLSNAFINDAVTKLYQWLRVNPNGGIFIYGEQKFLITKKVNNA
ncbi:MAG TPA: hypothetical protein VFW07_01400 [Parafilimonas sp.]|nr:hypothetical protein [Parafilimonas sp.]